MAEDLKVQGNKSLQSGDLKSAISLYTSALGIAPSKEVYGNRSLAHHRLNQLTEALADADQAIKLDPLWAKGYQRRGTALQSLRRYQEAVEAFKKGLELEPGNQQIQAGLTEAEQMLKWEEKQKKKQQDENEQFKMIQKLFEGDPLGQCRLMPEVKHLVDDVSFVKKVEEIREDPKKLKQYLHDEQILQFVSISAQYQHLSKLSDKERAELFIKQEEARLRAEKAEEEERDRRRQEEKKRKEEEERKKKEEEERKMTPEQKEARKLKDEGNEYYKKKDLTKALQCYEKAYQLDPNNIVYANNISAVLLTMKEYDKVIEVASKAVDKGRDLRAPFEQIGRALQRLGTAHLRKGDVTTAIEYYKKSQTEYRDPDTLKLLREAEKALEEKQKREYINPELSEKAKEEGNDFFKNGKFPEAVERYTEAIKRNPENHVLYTNRATAYTKLGAFSEALKDCDKCIEMSPKFVKAYLKKGNIYHVTKQYQKAIEVYEKALDIEPNNQLVKDAMEQTIIQVTTKGASADDVKRNLEKDPELQRILQDPMMQQVLESIKTGQPITQYLKDPKIAQNIEKLMMAGIIGTGRKH